MELRLKPADIATAGVNLIFESRGFGHQGLILKRLQLQALAQPRYNPGGGKEQDKADNHIHLAFGALFVKKEFLLFLQIKGCGKGVGGIGRLY